MKRADLFLWGLIGTLSLTGFMATSQGLGLTRMSLPYLMGSMLSPNPDRARLLGFAAHLVNGWLLAFLYAAVFRSLGKATLWLGASFGLLHGLFVLVAVVPLLPAVHPRIASERHGPTPTRQLAPPGFMGLNYGHRTPISILLAHTLYGAILGGSYRVR